MTRLWIAGPRRGQGRAGEGYHPGFFCKGVFFKKQICENPKNKDSRKILGIRPRGLEHDGVRVQRLKRERRGSGGWREGGRVMVMFTIELDEAKAAKADMLASYYNIPVEQLLRESAELGMEGKEVRMGNELADPLGKGDAYRGWMWKLHEARNGRR
jgi:hypothetical protein